jgi:hypothetical protein
MLVSERENNISWADRTLLWNQYINCNNAASFISEFVVITRQINLRSEHVLLQLVVRIKQLSYGHNKKSESLIQVPY